MKENVRIFIQCLAIIVLVFLAGCSATQTGRLKTEKDFQHAFNDVYFGGKGDLEIPVAYGRADILTGDFAIEVDRLANFHEGMGQALHYARATGKRPGLAIFIIDPHREDLKKLKYVSRLCEVYGITMWYINDELKKAPNKKKK